ncbi:MAG: hypothetical protein ACREDM_17085 [Methylocella sp.]
MSRRRAALHLAAGIGTAINWVRRFRETGGIPPRKMGGYRARLVERTTEKVSPVPITSKRQGITKPKDITLYAPASNFVTQTRIRLREAA